MRGVIIMTLAIGLSACASMPTGGIATLDTLRDAQAACAAKGNTLRLKRGGNPQYLEDYACEKE